MHNKLSEITIEKTCPKCGSNFSFIRKIKLDGTYSNSQEGPKFCSRKCANSRTNNREEINKKISQKLKKNM